MLIFLFPLRIETRAIIARSLTRLFDATRKFQDANSDAQREKRNGDDTTCDRDLEYDRERDAF